MRTREIVSFGSCSNHFFVLDYSFLFSRDIVQKRSRSHSYLVKKVNKMTIEFVQMWRNYESNEGKTPGFDMLRHYLDGETTKCE